MFTFTTLQNLRFVPENEIENNLYGSETLICLELDNEVSD